jgi:5-methylcytosine-specific restriction endonuclease McrA
MEDTRSLRSLSDDELVRRLLDLLRQSRRVEADLVAHIGEVGARRLYAREAAPSMFAYCTEVLHLSEAEAYLRITVARASREHPTLLEMLRDGRLHLSGIVRLAPHLGRSDRDALLARAAHRSKRGIEELIAELAPKPDVPTLVRRTPRPRAEEVLSEPSTPALTVQLCPDRVEAGASSATGTTVRPVPPEPLAPLVPPAVAPALPASPGSVQALAPARYKVQFTASSELVQKLDRLKALMRSAIPSGDLAALIEDAVSEKLAHLEARRFAETASPRKSLRATSTSPTSRYVPAAIRRAVYRRDGGRCAFVGKQGRRCTARDLLEFHHRRPFGYGGEHEPDNLSLMCRLCRARHNRHYADCRIMPTEALATAPATADRCRQSA